MTIDERIEALAKNLAEGQKVFDARMNALTARHEALSQSVELMVQDHRHLSQSVELMVQDHRRLTSEVMEGFGRLLNTGHAHNLQLADHEQRIEKLEGK